MTRIGQIGARPAVPRRQFPHHRAVAPVAYAPASATSGAHPGALGAVRGASAAIGYGIGELGQPLGRVDGSARPSARHWVR